MLPVANSYQKLLLKTRNFVLENLRSSPRCAAPERLRNAVDLMARRIENPHGTSRTPVPFHEVDLTPAQLDRRFRESIKDIPQRVINEYLREARDPHPRANPKQIKIGVEALIEREYLERESEGSNRYKYMA